MKTLILIPCYNEEKRLNVESFKDFLSVSQGINFLFVNDGSKDDTSRLLSELKDFLPSRIDIFDHPENKGKAEAIRLAAIHYQDISEFDIIGYFDADLATPLAAIQDLIGVFDAQPCVKIVMGSRIKRLGASIERNVSRHYFGRVFATFASLFLKLPVYDTQCGAKFFRKELIPIIFNEKFLSRWIFDVEIFARIIQNLPNYNQNIFFEFPLNEWKEIGGSKIRLKDLFNVPIELFKLKRKYQINA